MPRSRLGPLALEAKLGIDPAQSHVWRAVHVAQRKTVAVKIFNLPFGGTPEGRQQFSREWETLKRLRHPGIARCYGGGFDGRDAYLAYDLIDGETLADLIERRERLVWEAVLDLAEPLTEALGYAHDRQVTHGGLVPDKIIMAATGPVIVDYRVDRGQSMYRSQRPASARELAFQAPEVLEDARRAAPKSDLYSLGAILFYALTGRPPYTGASPDEVLRAVASQSPPKVASLVLDCPVWLGAVVDQLLERDPAVRPHGAAAVRLALAEVRRRATAGTGVAEHASGGFSPLRLEADKAEARALLGRAEQEEDEEEPDGTAFYEKSWFLVTALMALVGLVTWFVWPLNEQQLRARAEVLLEQDSRAAWSEARSRYLEPLLHRFPEGRHAEWAQEQLETIDMLEAERALDLKLQRGRELRGEGERLYAEARRFEQFGDTATALDKYRSLVTVLQGNETHRPYVNLARRQISEIQRGRDPGEAEIIVAQKLEEADRRWRSGQTIEARTIWYSIVELYGDNQQLAPLVSTAQQRLQGSAAESSRERPLRASPVN